MLHETTLTNNKDIRLPDFTLPPNLTLMQRRIGEFAVRTARLEPKIPGYILIEQMNKAIHPDILRESANILHHVFAPTEPEVIFTAAHSGIPLAKAVHERFPDTQFSVAEKLSEGHTEGYYKILHAPSYSRQKDVPFGVPFIGNRRVLFIDDVLAHFGIGGALINELILQGSQVVGTGVNMCKRFQDGHQKIAEKGIPFYSVIDVTNIVEQHGKLGITVAGVNDVPWNYQLPNQL